MLEKIVAKAENFDIDKIMGNPAVIILCVIFLYPPSLFNRLDIISTYDLYIRIVLIFIVFAVYLLRLLKIKKVSIFFIIFNIFCLWQFIVTFINKTDIPGAIWGAWIMTDAVYCFLEMEISINKEKILKYFYYIVFIEIIINMITVIYWDNTLSWIPDMNEYFFFGNHNIFINMFLPEIFIGYYLMLKNNDKKIIYTFILCVISIVITFYYERSVSSILVLGMIIVFMTLFNNVKLSSIFNLRNYSILIALVFFVFIFIQPDGGLIEKVFGILGKNTTLTGRTPIWNEVKQLILENPIVGYGIYSTTQRNAIYGYGHAHNIILEKFFTTGIIGAAIFFYLWSIIYKNICHIKDIKLRGLFSICVLAFFVRGQMESGAVAFVTMVMFLLFLLSQEDNNIKEKNYITLKFLDK